MKKLQSFSKFYGSVNSRKIFNEIIQTIYQFVTWFTNSENWQIKITFIMISKPKKIDQIYRHDKIIFLS